jgi:hypothetical protein
VTLNGQPVEGALVEFTPVAAAAGVAGAQALTDAAGRYEAATLRDNGKTVEPGLPAGEYRVTVSKLEAPPGDASLSRPPRNVLPPKYQSVDSSPLTATVSSDGDNTVDVKL